MVMFIDSPLNVGLSYSGDTGVLVDNTVTAGNRFTNFMFNFYNQWYPNLKSNPLYIFGESYGGKFYFSILIFFS